MIVPIRRSLPMTIVDTHRKSAMRDYLRDHAGIPAMFRRPVAVPASPVRRLFAALSLPFAAFVPLGGLSSPA